MDSTPFLTFPLPSQSPLKCPGEAQSSQTTVRLHGSKGCAGADCGVPLGPPLTGWSREKVMTSHSVSSTVKG